MDAGDTYILLLVQICNVYKYKRKSTNTAKTHFPTATALCIHEAVFFVRFLI